MRMTGAQACFLFGSVCRSLYSPHCMVVPTERFNGLIVVPVNLIVAENLEATRIKFNALLIVNMFDFSVSTITITQIMPLGAGT